jgi:hypothetical protein
VRWRVLLVALPVAAAAAAAALVLRFGGDDLGDPGQFIAGVVRDLAGNDYEGAWGTLHPLHQGFVARGEYVACEGQSPIPGHVSSLQVLSVADKRLSLPGQTGKIDAKAVRIKLALAVEGGDPIVVTTTGHAVAVGGHWSWILPADRLAEYRAGRCPS